MSIDYDEVAAVLAGQTGPVSTSEVAVKIGSHPDNVRPVLNALEREGLVVSGTPYDDSDLVPSTWDGRQRYWASVKVANAFREQRAAVELAEHAVRMTVETFVAGWTGFGGPAQPVALGLRTHYPRGRAGVGPMDTVDVELVLTDEQLVWLTERLSHL